MNRDAMLELRVLTGIHAGARALLGDQPQLLGSGDDCALILCDDGVLERHATLEPGPEGHIVVRWVQPDRPPLTLQPGEGFRMGSVQVAVERSDTPWRGAVPSHPDDPAGEAASPGTQASHGQVEMAPAAPAGHRRWAPGIFLLAALGIVIGGASAVWRNSGEATDAAASTPTRAPAQDAAQADAVAQAVARLGLSTRVTIDRADAQAPVLHTRFLSDEESEVLAFTVSRVSPRAQVKAASGEELAALLTAAIQVPAQQSRPQPVARHLGASRFRIEGRVADDTQRAQVMARLEQQFPGATGLESGMTTDEEAAKAFLDELQRQAVGKVTGRWIDGRLQVDAQVPPGREARWEGALQTAATRHAVAFEARVAAAQVTADPTSSDLPFTVRSIVSSAMPYVVLADGRKLMRGGREQGWLLTGIHANAVSFENSRGQKVTLER